MAKTVTVEVFSGKRLRVVGGATMKQQNWYWRLRWQNGRIAATSESYLSRSTATRLAKKMATALGTIVVTPQQPAIVKAVKKTIRKQQAVAKATAAVSTAKREQTEVTRSSEF